MVEIQIVYNDGMLGFVEPQELSRLIDAGEIVKFLRNDSWIYLGVDPVRTGGSNPVPAGKRMTDINYRVA